MKRNYIYIVLMLAFAALASCQRTEPAVDFADDLILLQPKGNDVTTKGFINKTDLETATSAQVKVFDFLTGFEGTVTPAPVEPESYADGFYYINDVITNDGNNNWSFTNNIAWRWTRTGNHKFFGWLVSDGATTGTGHAATELGITDASYDPTSKILTVPEITFTKTTPQFDFSYSDIVEKDVANHDFNAANPINLPLKHLFSAVAIEVKNSTTDKAYIKKLELKNFKSKKSATVIFSGAISKPVYENSDSQPEFAFTWPSEATVDANYGHLISNGTPDNPTRFDIIDGHKLSYSAEPNYFMIWPQLAEDFSSATAPATIEVEYYIEGVMDPEDDTKYAKKTKTIVIPSAVEMPSMDAGVKYVISLEFKEKTLLLTLVPMPWTMDYMDIDYASSSILANSNKDNEGVLWLYRQEEGVWKAGPRDRQISMTGGNPIQGRFYILAPTSGKWQVTTFPAEAAQYFIIAQKDAEGHYVQQNNGIIEDLVDDHGVFTGYVEFYVLPNPEHPTLPATQYLNFNIDFLINGEWRNGNTEFNRKNWTIVREPGN